MAVALAPNGTDGGELPISAGVLERVFAHQASAERAEGLDEERIRDGGIGRRLREIILGGQDGLVNVLGLVLGIAAATARTRVILVAGLAATFSESIAMAGVAYTSAVADRDYRLSQHRRGHRAIEEVPDGRADGVMGAELPLSPATSSGLVDSAAITGIATLVGSLIPLIPFFFLPIGPATIVALPLCAAVLFGVGAYKALTTVGDWRISGAQMLLIGMVSAFAGYVIGRLLHVSGA